MFVAAIFEFNTFDGLFANKMKIKGHYILYNDPDSDGRKTIYIRYYKSGFAIKRSTGFKVLPADWDKDSGQFVPSSPAAKRLNRRLKYVQDLTDRSIASLKSPSVNQIQDELDYVFVNELSKGQRLDFLEFCEELVNKRKYDGEYDINKSNEYIKHIRNFRQFLHKRLDIYHLPIAEFRSNFVDLYSAYLRKNFIPEEMIYKFLTPVSNGIQQAAKEGLVEESIASEIVASCMLERSIAKVDNTRKCLSCTDLATLSEYRDLLEEGPMKDALDFFLMSATEFALSLYELMLLRWSDIDLGKGQLRRPKYRTSSPSDVILPLGREPLSILARWRGRHPNFVFGLMEDFVNVNDSYILKQMRAKRGRRINKLLSDAAATLGIDNSLTMQVARNTFAAITLSRGGSLYVVSKALGHASTAVTVAMYGKYLKQSERNEMDRIINLL